MSAYLCDPTHISACAEIIHGFKQSGYGDWSYLPQSKEAIFTVLLAENIRSLRARYSDSSRDEVSAGLMRFKPQDLESPASSRIGIKSVLIAYYKALQCLEYQSCEASDYAETIAGKAIAQAQDFLARSIIRNLPEYDKSAWGWEPAKGIRLV